MSQVAATAKLHPLAVFVAGVIREAKLLKAEDVLDLMKNFPSYYMAWWISLYREAPYHLIVETGLLCFIFWLMFIRRTVSPEKTSKESNKLTPKEMDELIAEWTPEPLAGTLDDYAEHVAASQRVIEDVKGNMIKLRGMSKMVLNMGTGDFLGLGQAPSVKEVSAQALTTYGCGSCGPRGFYGTIDSHLQIEKDVTTFLGTEEAITYSDGASTITSAITAFAKRTDMLLVDEGVSEPVRAGVALSRAKVVYYRHNDMDDLLKKLKEIKSEDKRKKRDPKDQRRFIVTEAIFKNTGKITDLPALLRLKEEFKYRLILDESLSFGTLGASGKGLTEHFNLPIESAEIIKIGRAHV